MNLSKINKNFITTESKSEIGEFEKIQLEQSMETFRMIQNRLFMVILGLIVANVTIIGFAIEKQKPLIALIGVACYFLMWFYIKVCRRFMSSAITTAMSIEEKYGDKNIEWLVTSSLKKSVNKEVRKKIIDINYLQNQDERLKAIQNLSITGYTGNKYGVQILIFGICLIQIIVTILLAIK